MSTDGFASEFERKAVLSERILSFTYLDIVNGVKMPRRTFFSFHYGSDVWRAWNVRNSWVVKEGNEIDRGFFDSSVFEASKKENDDTLKKFLREGLENTSVTCVLTGTETWKRRWVRYEIARSIIKGNGLLNVYIHGIQNKDKKTSEKGANPLAQMGLYKSDNGIYLAEWNGEKWVKYADYTTAIPARDLWFAAPETNNVVQLSTHCLSFDFKEDEGRKNIGVWIETAAGMAGR
ncbi:TIR domain-containing protein [Enterobacter kobei]|nr:MULTISPECIES: TIR domain-containing protein [Enterobacter]MCK7157749.1 TIR domain-containing protein [Enterobacter kobei]MCK7243498.1 TIR domain-containing protein [Enterobacter kobei]MCK7359488.1 TIR domain-containing protein [Enterobacter roggenkampii]MCO6029647.1 TIR domain-containing protein [Enterobacter hormaechei]